MIRVRVLEVVDSVKLFSDVVTVRPYVNALMISVSAGRVTVNDAAH